MEERVFHQLANNARLSARLDVAGDIEFESLIARLLVRNQHLQHGHPGTPLLDLTIPGFACRGILVPGIVCGTIRERLNAQQLPTAS